MYFWDTNGNFQYFCNTNQCIGANGKLADFPGETVTVNGDTGTVDTEDPIIPPSIPSPPSTGSNNGQRNAGFWAKPNGGYPDPPGFKDSQCKAVTNETEKLDQAAIVTGIVTMWGGPVTYPYATGIGIADLLAHWGKEHWCN